MEYRSEQTLLLAAPARTKDIARSPCAFQPFLEKFFGRFLKSLIFATL